MSHCDGFTIDGHRISQSFKVASELVQMIEDSFGVVWVCTCGVSQCHHVKTA